MNITRAFYYADKLIEIPPDLTIVESWQEEMVILAPSSTIPTDRPIDIVIETLTPVDQFNPVLMFILDAKHDDEHPGRWNAIAPHGMRAYVSIKKAPQTPEQIEQILLKGVRFIRPKKGDRT